MSWGSGGPSCDAAEEVRSRMGCNLGLDLPPENGDLTFKAYLHLLRRTMVGDVEDGAVSAPAAERVQTGHFRP